MNTSIYPASMMMLRETFTGLNARLQEAEPLVQTEKVAAFVGDDPETQQQVFHLCLDLVTTSLPAFRRAMESGDHATARHIAHDARGSLGMLGLPRLQELGEEIEYRLGELGNEAWQQRCEELYALLQNLQHELSARVAA